jgi:hypothetical protein
MQLVSYILRNFHLFVLLIIILISIYCLQLCFIIFFLLYIPLVSFYIRHFISVPYVISFPFYGNTLSHLFSTPSFLLYSLPSD